ncbi:hypothetical protein LOZ58_000833 [Ophidiomyces ophidiicola]|nr:hypothetical protein LOZ58_000833 [Ophidiomyces ophidiicola]
MARTGLIYMAGALSTIFTLLSTVANGAFATSISRELSGLGAFQAVSVTGCALSCVLQGFLVFFLRRRLNRHVHVAKQQERRALIAVAVVLGLDVAVVAMAIRWSSTRIGEISSGETRGDVRLLFALWCTLWAIAVVFQVTCFGVLVVWGRDDTARRRRRSTVPAKLRHTKRLDHDEDDEENRILGSIEQARSTQQGPGDEPPEKPRSRASSMSQLKISYFLRDLAGEQEPPADHHHQQQQPGARKSSSDSQRWERGFSRRVPELHDELQKINLHASASTATLSTYMHGGGGSSVRRHDALYPAPLSGSRSPSRGAAAESCRHSTMRGTPSPAFSRRKDDKQDEKEEEEEPVVEAAAAENIHPLFRSSALSIPGVSPGTTVTASPFAGQTISMHTLQQIRSRGRPRSQSLGVHYRRQQQEEKEEGKEEEKGEGKETAGGSSRYPSGAEAVEENSSSSSSSRRNSGSGGGGGGGRRKSQMSVGRRGSSLPPCR